MRQLFRRVSTTSHSRRCVLSQQRLHRHDDLETRPTVQKAVNVMLPHAGRTQLDFAFTLHRGTAFVDADGALFSALPHETLYLVPPYDSLTGPLTFWHEIT